MTFAALLILVGIALAAAAFAARPIIRTKTIRGRALLAGAIALFVIAVGAGSYLMLGRPALALRAFHGADPNNLNALITLLAGHMQTAPDDIRGWTILGKAYITAGDPDDAAKAYARAIVAARAQRKPLANLYSGYGEALTRANSGIVTPEAEAAFNAALTADPKDLAARYFLGMAHAMRGDNQTALALWQSLLADTPPDAPYRGELIDRIAALSSGAAPDIGAMVEGLAARLRSQPDDAQGWQRLVHAYAVLGRQDKAKTALASARTAMAHRPDVLAALSAEAKELRLE